MPIRAPSITRLFAATFIAVALVGLVTQVATWHSARATQLAMVELARRLEPSDPAAAELATDAGDDAVQAAIAASVLFVAMLIVLGLGFWYNRRRLAAPFARIADALQRVAQGQFLEPLREDQPGEFGAIASGVNHMAKTLAWREELQAYLSQLLAALNTSADDAATGLAQALGVIAGATKAAGIVLYQPAYDSNEWAPTAARGIESRPVSRASFEFIFVYGVIKYSSFIPLQVVDQFSQHHLLKRLSLIHCIFLPPLSKIRCPYVRGFISGLSILFH